MATVSKDSPRLLRDKDGNECRVTTQIDYVSLISGYGYRDVTDEKASQKKSASSGSSKPAAQSDS